MPAPDSAHGEGRGRPAAADKLGGGVPRHSEEGNVVYYTSLNIVDFTFPLYYPCVTLNVVDFLTATSILCDLLLYFLNHRKQVLGHTNSISCLMDFLQSVGKQSNTYEPVYFHIRP